MAGSYPDVPSRRMAYDADGTVLLNRRTDTASFPWMEIGTTERTQLNEEDTTQKIVPQTAPFQFNDNDGELCFIFPELREIDGLFVQHDVGTVDRIKAVDVSADTTNGIGGTFSSLIANYTDVADVIDSYRDNITSLASSNNRAVRIKYDDLGGTDTEFRMIHLYGEISTGETPDRLLWIDEVTGLEFTSDLDFGDVPRGGSEDREVRLRNNSATLTADTIQYTAEDLYLTAAAWFTATLPSGSTFNATQQIASLAPATTTGIITLRRITPGTEIPLLYAAREYADVGSWA